MHGFIVFLLIVLLIYCSTSWILPKVLAWIFEHKFKVIIRIGRIGIPYLKLCDVHIEKNGFTVHIDEISIKSSFLNSELTKLITLVVKDVRINKDIQTAQISRNTDLHLQRACNQQPLDFRNKKIPHFITTFAQFMAVHVYNISTMLLHSESPGWLIHATANELHLDGSIVQNARTLLVNITMSEASAKLLQHPKNQVNENTCLAELSFAITMEATLVAQGALSVEKLFVNTSQTAATINDGFYSLAQDNRNTTNPTVERDYEEDVYYRILPIIPKNFTYKMEELSLRGVRQNSRTEFMSSLKSLSVTSRFINTNTNQGFPRMSYSFQMNDLHIYNSKEELLLLKTLTIDAKLADNVINLYLKLNTLLLAYNHEAMHHWIETNFLRNTKKIPNQILNTDKINQIDKTPMNKNLIEKLLKTLTINGCAEFRQVSALFNLCGDKSSMGFNHIKVNLQQSPETREATYEKYLPKLLLANRHWQFEVLMESFWWSFRERNYESLFSKKIHHWGTPVFLGMTLFKFGTYGSIETKIESLLDTLQLEWSFELATYIILAVKCFKQYKIRGRRSVQEPAQCKDENYIAINLALSHFNCFLLTHDNEYVVARLNSVTLDKNFEKTQISFKGFKIATVKNSNTFYSCIRSEDIQNYKVFVKLAQIEVLNQSSDITIHLLEDVVSHWSTNLHLKIITLQREMEHFFSDLNHNLCEVTDASKKTTAKPWKLHICGVFAFHILISEKHSGKIALDEITVSKTKDNLSISNGTAVISIDGSDIFTLQGFQLAKIKFNEMIKTERLDNETFQLPWNKTWGLTIDLFRATFPHEHYYAEAIQNEFISIWKWLKVVHNRKKAPFTSQSPLPSDLLINIKEFLFEMSDDPFEVKLRDNYELLVDEYNESLKRQKMLKAKISELCKTHLHLPAGKVEELYANLSKKNAEIYIQRSKQMLYAAPSRTRLFAWNMTDIKVMVLADPSIHGTDNVIRVMRDIDFESPWPEEPIEFSILWCRVVSMRCKEWKFQLRDFRQPLLLIRECYVCGQLVGAEQAAPRRATRDVVIELGDPWGSVTIERSMLPLKFYHDFNCEVESYSYAFGPCWEPVIAQCNLTFEKIIAPSRDPSPPLPFWDKMRLLLHGRLTMVVQQLTVLLHASLDPYNTTEEMELTWNQVVMDWTNGKFVYKGDLNIFVRTASKYDDCKLLHLPNLKLIVNIQWACLGDPNDHHSVIQCAPDKVPEYSSNQVHDSFRAFRSQNINLGIVLETKPISNQSPSGNIDYPMLSLYSSTLRWIENLKLILSGVTRPTRRGRIFKNVRPRKIQLSRHYKKVHLLMGLHKFQVCYWMSFAMQRGFEILGGRLSSSAEHTLSLVPIDDGLKHRPKAEWSIVYMNSELNDTEIWLKSALQEDPEKEAISLRQPVEKCFCLSVAKVSYGRETVVLPASDRNKDTPTHRLVVYDLKGAWTKSNRNVAFALFDSFMRNQRMKKNLSTEALKSFRKETNSTPLKRRGAETAATGTPANPSIQALQSTSTVKESPSPLSKIQSGHAANMLKQLIAEADNKAMVFSDDLSSATRQQHLQGLQACQEDDVLHKNWLIVLVNAQVLLKGCETKGYVILSSAKAEILQRIHRPVWKDRTLVSKTTWVGSLECLQYYATVNAGENDSLNENIMWLTVDNIQEKESKVISEIPQVPNIVGSGVSVGAVVSDVVGAGGTEENWPIQLQRIVSRCKCEFFYAGYGDISVDPEEFGDAPSPPQEDVGLWDRRQTAVDAFTLMHHDLDVCTNSLQYAMLLDIVNNLLLYVEPHRKEALERLARMRFQLQLHSVEDQRRPIQSLQNQIRSSVSKLRRLEKETYLVNKAVAEEPNNLELLQEMENLEELVYNCKGQLNAQSEELDMMISCYKESQLLANSRMATTRSDKPLTMVRANEICFKHAQWRLTEADGQIGIADLVLSNFLYTKNSKSDDSVEHLLELGYVRMTNLLPNQIYKEVLLPTEIQSNMPVEHKRVVRVFCREKPPVGGISVKEHFEINVVPLTIGLTKKFYNTMLKFCFPEKDPENIESERGGEEIDSESRNRKYRSSGRAKRDSNFYIPIDDVEKMKERAEKNKLFIYIKIPEVPVRVSYKGNKEKNLEDIRDFSLTIPTLEYHNVTWTWLDLLLAMKSDTRRVILSQAIKQKLQIKRSTGLSDESSSPQDEDKARLLFGARHLTENRSTRKGMSSVFKFGKQ